MDSGLVKNGLFALALAAVIAITVRLTMSEKMKPEAAEANSVSVVEEAIEPDELKRSGMAAINRRDDGHYWTTADVDGVAVKFMVDTGASIVALTWKDAERLELDPENLTFDTQINTAGGTVYGAYVTLPSIRIGNVEVENVDALVLENQLDQSLLGMSFLNELYSYEFRKSQLIIRQ